MSYYGTGFHGTNHYATNYYGAQEEIVVDTSVISGGIGSYKDKAYHQNLEDELIIEMVLKKFVEVINAT